jgi:hypothetical protein
LTTQANVLIGRLWRSLEYELVYPGDFQDGAELYAALGLSCATMKRQCRFNILRVGRNRKLPDEPPRASKRLV